MDRKLLLSLDDSRMNLDSKSRILMAACLRVFGVILMLGPFWVSAHPRTGHPGLFLLYGTSIIFGLCSSVFLAAIRNKGGSLKKFEERRHRWYRVLLRLCITIFWGGMTLVGMEMNRLGVFDTPTTLAAVLGPVFPAVSIYLAVIRTSGAPKEED